MDGDGLGRLGRGGHIEGTGKKGGEMKAFVMNHF